MGKSSINTQIFHCHVSLSKGRPKFPRWSRIILLFLTQNTVVNLAYGSPIQKKPLILNIFDGTQMSNRQNQRSSSLDNPWAIELTPFHNSYSYLIHLPISRIQFYRPARVEKANHNFHTIHTSAIIPRFKTQVDHPCILAFSAAMLYQLHIWVSTAHNFNYYPMSNWGNLSWSLTDSVSQGEDRITPCEDVFQWEGIIDYSL